MNWYVLCVKKGKELKVAEDLRASNIEVYCPMRREVRQWSDRKKKVQTPLFPTYIFVRLEAKDRNMVFSVPFILKYLFWLGKPAIVYDYEIKAITLWHAGEYANRIDMKSGDKIVIQQGPFKGHEAVIEEAGKKRVKLVLHKLGLQLNTGYNMVMAS